MRATLMILGGAVAASLAGCGCTKEGCEGSVALTLEGADTYGVYTASLIAETDAIDCVFTLTEAGPETSSYCAVYSDLEGDAIELTFWMPSDEPHGELDIEVYFTPEDDPDSEVTVGELNAEPEYEEFTPNGKRCGPACYSAAVSMTLEAP